MSCLGVHFALNTSQVAGLRLRVFPGLRVQYVQGHLEEQLIETPFAAETDKAWDAIHRCLGDGSLNGKGGSFPLNHVVLGGSRLWAGDSYILSLKSPRTVRAIAKELPQVTQDLFRGRYAGIAAAGYEGPIGVEDFEYTWEWFQGLVPFFKTAAAHDRWVLFTADQ
jgi:Domain of unknown function (DUF1877)